MSTSASTLKLVRKVHLYFGVFISPAILFFAVTGALQSFNLHATTPGSSYKPAKWILTLAQLHKRGTTQITVRKPTPDASTKVVSDKTGTANMPTQPAAAASKTSDAQSKPKNHLPMKLFFVVVSLGLAVSTFSGIFMAHKYSRNKFLVAGLLLAGIVIPLLLNRL
ncbi:MAG TPA: hypothetical protein VNW54_00590 [Granulicella sp.]|jgi:hypothetical protein|nr:hypothetical protein [Granulicella sp.]